MMHHSLNSGGPLKAITAAGLLPLLLWHLSCPDCFQTAKRQHGLHCHHTSPGLVDIPAAQIQVPLTFAQLQLEHCLHMAAIIPLSGQNHGNSCYQAAFIKTLADLDVPKRFA